MPEPALFLTDADTARALFVTPRTLHRWRQDGTGPVFVRLGRRVAYRRQDIEAWAQARTFPSRADELASEAQPTRHRRDA